MEPAGCFILVTTRPGLNLDRNDQRNVLPTFVGPMSSGLLTLGYVPAGSCGEQSLIEPSG